LEDRNDLTFAQREDLIAHEFVSVWEKDHHKLRFLSKAINMKLNKAMISVCFIFIHHEFRMPSETKNISEIETETL